MMKSIVIYYSQTGNTKKIAQAIHTGMSELSEQCDIARLQDIDTEDLTKYDLIGLGEKEYRELPGIATRGHILYH